MFPSSEPEVAAVVTRFALPPNFTSERQQSGGGFSGARLWKLTAGERSWCLRCYGAEHPTAARLAAIHSAVSAAIAKGMDFLAAPLADHSGATVIRAYRRLWDLSPWLAGEAVTAPTREQMRNAFAALARLHLAWRNQLWHDLAVDLEGTETLGPPPGLNARRRFLTELAEGGLREIERRLPSFHRATWFTSAERILAEFRSAATRETPRLQSAARELVPRQVCLRDARPEHFLYVGDRLCGVIDYDAVRVDSPTADLARLCGAWGREAIAEALNTYSAIRPLTDAERRVFDAALMSAKLLTGVQWLQWLVVEQRTFDEAVVAERFRVMLAE